MADTTSRAVDEFVARWPALEERLAALFSARVGAYGADVEDLISKVKERLLGALRDSARSVDDPVGFAFGIAHNLCYEYVREMQRRAREVSLESDPELALSPNVAADPARDADDTDEDDARAERLRALRECLAELSPQQRDLILAFYAPDARVAGQRAELVGDTGHAVASRNALYLRVSRIRRRLRACVETRDRNPPEGH
jgi:RNA polymerase sigma factor (sigma-70 family)